jgi:uncharacterized protein (DUF1919 family)
MTKLNAETIRLKFRNDIYLPATRNARRRTLKTTDFTIISNNCWGGTVYESYGLQKNSPTVGMFIMPEDFLTLAGNLAGELARPLEFVSPDASKWRAELGDKANWGGYLIGRIGDVELHMLHYHDQDTARRKWQSRVQRVNFQNLIFKLNDQNGCTDDHAARFDDLGIENKIFFTVRSYPALKSAVMIPHPKSHGHIRASYEPIGANRAFNVNRYLSSRLTHA